MADERAHGFAAVEYDGTDASFTCLCGEVFATTGLSDVGGPFVRHLREHRAPAAVVRLPPSGLLRPASREGDGLPEGWQQRLARVAKSLSETAATTDAVLLRVYPDDFATRFPFAADLRAALAAAEVAYSAGRADERAAVATLVAAVDAFLDTEQRFIDAERVADAVKELRRVRGEHLDY